MTERLRCSPLPGRPAVGTKTIGNYVNHVADTPRGRELRPFASTAGAPA
jgi:hypothetical protein